MNVHGTKNAHKKTLEKIIVENGLAAKFICTQRAITMNYIGNLNFSEYSSAGAHNSSREYSFGFNVNVSDSDFWRLSWRIY